MKKRLLALVLSLVMAASCVACGGGSDKETKAAENTANEAAEGGSNTVVVAMGGGFSTLDPGYVYEKFPPVAITACYENLFKFYGDSEPMPCLADTYEFTNEGLTLTVTLISFSVSPCTLYLSLTFLTSILTFSISLSVDTPSDNIAVILFKDIDLIPFGLVSSNLNSLSSLRPREGSAPFVRERRNRLRCRL